MRCLKWAVWGGDDSPPVMILRYFSLWDDLFMIRGAAASDLIQMG